MTWYQLGNRANGINSINKVRVDITTTLFDENWSNNFKIRPLETLLATIFRFFFLQWWCHRKILLYYANFHAACRKLKTLAIRPMETDGPFDLLAKFVCIFCLNCRIQNEIGKFRLKTCRLFLLYKEFF